MPLFVDNVQINQVYVDGVEQATLVVDGVTVWTRNGFYQLGVVALGGARYGYVNGIGGSITPTTYGGIFIDKLDAYSDSKQVAMIFGGGVQLPGINVLRAKVNNNNITADLAYSTGVYFVSNTAFADYIVSQAGNTIDLNLEVIS